MTYYGRWTYKFEEGARKGAAGVLIVHETGPAGYPFSVVQGNLSEKFDLVTPDKNMGRAAIEGWVTLDAAKKMLKIGRPGFRCAEEAGGDPRLQAGAARPQGLARDPEHDADDRLAQRRRRSSKAATRRTRTSTSSTPRTGITSASARRSRATRSTTARSTTRPAWRRVLEIARAFTKVQPQPKRSVLFLMVTAEEQGLLGSQYYAATPIYPLHEDARQHQHRRRQPVGPHQGHHRHRPRRVGPRRLPAGTPRPSRTARCARIPSPKKGFYYRSDHFNFAKQGVPALDPDAGIDFIGKPAGLRQAEARRVHRTTTTTRRPTR